MQDLGVPDDPRKPVLRRDVDAANFREFKKAMSQGFTKFFGKYGDGQLHLWLLCTHPSFRRRGAATRLCEWGLRFANSRGLCVTVLASPMGKSLYEKLDFFVCDWFYINVEGDPTALKIWALEYFNKEQKYNTGSLAHCWVQFWRALWTTKNTYGNVSL